jgi:hypothetical protein
MKRNSKQLAFFLLAAVALCLAGCESVVVNYKSNVDSDHSEVLDQTEINPATEVGL